MSTAKRLVTATLSYGLASYLPRLVNFALLPVYARYLAPEEMGILEVLTALEALLAAVSRLGLPGALSRQYFDNRDAERFRDLITTTALAMIASCAAFTLLAWVIGPFVFAAELPEIPFHPYVEIALATSFLRAAPELQARILQATEQARTAATLNVGMSLLGTATRVALVVGLEWSVLGALWAELATAVVGALIAVYRHRKDLRGKVRPEMLKPSLAYGLPLVPHHLGQWLADFGGRSVMGGLGVLATVGQLGIATRMMSPIQIAASAFATAFGPVYFGWRADLPVPEAVREVRRTSSVVLGLGSVLALGAATLGNVALRWFLPEAYRPGADAVGLLAAGLVVRIMYNILGMELLFAKRTAAISTIFFAGSFVTIGLTVLLVERAAIVGAAAAQALGTATSVALTAVLARQTFPLALAPRAVAAVLSTAAIAAASPWIIPGTSMIVDTAVAMGVWVGAASIAMVIAGVRPRDVRSYLELRKKKRKKKGPPAADET